MKFYAEELSIQFIETLVPLMPRLNSAISRWKISYAARRAALG